MKKCLALCLSLVMCMTLATISLAKDKSQSMEVGNMTEEDFIYEITISETAIPVDELDNVESMMPLSDSAEELFEILFQNVSESYKIDVEYQM